MNRSSECVVLLGVFAAHGPLLRKLNDWQIRNLLMMRKLKVARELTFWVTELASTVATL